MSINYEIVIKELETVNKFGIEKIIRRIHWNMEATDSDTGKKGVVRNVDVFEIDDYTFLDYAKNKYITVPAEFNVNDYTPYSEVTKDMIEEWLAGKLGEQTIQKHRETALKNLQEKLNNNTGSSIQQPPIIT